MDIKGKAKELKSNISTVYIALKNNHTPIYAKIVAAITVGYALSPIDIIPDFVPILGYLDDLIILPLMVFICIKLIPKKIWEISKEEAKDIWKNGKPKKWYYGIPIIFLWGLIIYLICKAIL